MILHATTYLLPYPATKECEFIPTSLWLSAKDIPHFTEDFDRKGATYEIGLELMRELKRTIKAGLNLGDATSISEEHIQQSALPPVVFWRQLLHTLHQDKKFNIEGIHREPTKMLLRALNDKKGF